MPLLPAASVRESIAGDRTCLIKIAYSDAAMAFFDKHSERQCLEYFLNARRSATGEKLTLLAESESPDFVCTRPNGDHVGVEHTRIKYNPERTEILQSCNAYDGELDNFAVFFAAASAIAKKEHKRRKPHWKYPDATILVLDLPEAYRFEDWPADSALSEDFRDSGFMEVWISDHSSIEAYGEVTAIGLYPPLIWGIQGQGYLWGVPYK